MSDLRRGASSFSADPRGVTTGSDAGVESYERYFDVFAEMERLNLVLNLHGELPSSARDVRCFSLVTLTVRISTSLTPSAGFWECSSICTDAFRDFASYSSTLRLQRRSRRPVDVIVSC